MDRCLHSVITVTLLKCQFSTKKTKIFTARKFELTLHDLPEVYLYLSLSDGRLGDNFQQALLRNDSHS